MSALADFGWSDPPGHGAYFHTCSDCGQPYHASGEYECACEPCDLCDNTQPELCSAAEATTSDDDRMVCDTCLDALWDERGEEGR